MPTLSDSGTEPQDSQEISGLGQYRSSRMLIVLLVVVGATASFSHTDTDSLLFQSEAGHLDNKDGDNKSDDRGVGFSFSIDDKARFNFTQAGKTWLQSAPSFIYTDGKRYSTEDDSLKLNHVGTEQGEDKVSSWTSRCFTYQAGQRTLKLCAKQWGSLYPDIPAVLFQQYFVDGTNNSARDPDSVISGFPSFQVPDEDVDLSYVSFQGTMFGGPDIVVKRWQADTVSLSGGLMGGPVAVFDRNGGVCIMAPFSQFMSTSRELDDRKRVNWGVMGGVGGVPTGFLQETLVYCGFLGLNQMISQWGMFMRSYYNKRDTYRHSDLTINYLGYWTDGGAYYYYHTEKNKTYEDTLLDLKNYTQAQNIPYRYVQYDSWFYAKGPHSGVLTWTATEDIAPHGLQYLMNKNRWPVAAHNKFWSSKTPYAKVNGGLYDFIVESEKALPQELEFWRDLFLEARTWGITMYEQDWLDEQFSGMKVTLTTVGVARAWLMQMGQAARDSGLSIQYCTASPRFAMQSLEIPVVTQARVSQDYRAGVRDQWRIGEVSIFADALGIAPFKDTFWTTKIQPGNPYNLSEPNYELQAAVSTLSTGPVGPSDMIGHTNVSMLMQCCRSDGLILKPSKPATAIDRQFWQRAWGGGEGPGGEVWTTYSQVGLHYFGIILAAAMDNEPIYNITPVIAGFNFFKAQVVIRRSADSVTPIFYPFSADQPLQLTNLCTREHICMYYTSPIFYIGNGTQIVIYGEEYKFVPMSANRFSNLDVTPNDVMLTLQGVPGESTVISYFYDGSIVRLACNFGPTGRSQLSLKNFHNSCVDA